MLACRSAPTAPADFDVCLHRGSEIQRTSSGTQIGPGSGNVLDLHSSWGESILISDTGRYALAWIELPDPLTAGDVVAIDGRDALLRNGGQIVAFESRELHGTVTVSEVSPDETAFDLDLRALNPTVDIDHRRVMPLLGPVVAPDCP